MRFLENNILKVCLGHEVRRKMIKSESKIINTFKFSFYIGDFKILEINIMAKLNILHKELYELKMQEANERRKQAYFNSFFRINQQMILYYLKYSTEVVFFSVLFCFF